MVKKDIQTPSKTNENCSDTPLNNKWKKYLLDYRNYTKEYSKHYRKSLKGNLISLSIYPYMKARAEALLELLFDAKKKNLLTEEQQEKLEKIHTQSSNF